MKGKIFNAQEVQAIIAGNKTQFREVIKPQPPLGCHYTINGNQSHALCFADCSTPRDERDYSKEPLVCVPPKGTSVDHRLKCPYQVGQKIFCKESFSYSDKEWCDKTIFYKASHGNRIQHTFSVSNREKKWRSPMVMQEYDSRLTLQIKEIRVERLQDISEEDCLKEAISEKTNFQTTLGSFQIRDSFKTLWNATHKKPEEKWKANPFVFVYSFEVVK